MFNQANIKKKKIKQNKKSTNRLNKNSALTNTK